MFKTRESIEAHEESFLAPYAQKASLSAGRHYPEQEHLYRTCYQRDRARIIHSGAFRRLDGKTQVFLNGSGDYYRTRLTHTMEVASISRTIAQALSLNTDLAECIALAHDLGHSPFGHAGEEELNLLMKKHGGFEHNMQSLRVVGLIESKYPDFPGLNLSQEVLEGLQKHKRPSASESSGGPRYYCPTLEAQTANLADEITYYSHDLDDGLESGLLTADQLMEVDVWRDAMHTISSGKRRLTKGERNRYIIRCIVNREVEDLIYSSSEAIQKSGVASVEDVKKQKHPLIRYSDALKKSNAQLRKFLYKKFYHHPVVADINREACRRLEEIFHFLLENPGKMGPKNVNRTKEYGLERTATDYLSGMTDRYLVQKYGEWIGKEKLKTPYHI
ncbi:MAG: deoxyguanosinetriphosphate triphosphohydrolase [Chthoniobacterales bacterium]